MITARKVVRVVKAAGIAWWNDDVPRLGASLAYYTLFAVAPILIVAIAIAGLVFGKDAVRGDVVAQIEGLVGHAGAEAVQSLLQGAAHRSAGIIATILGTVTALIAATGAFLELQTDLNLIWKVPPEQHPNVRAFLVNRLRALGLMIAIGFLLMVSLVVSAGLAALGGWLGHSTFGTTAMWAVVNIIVSLGVVTTLFALLFKVLPRTVIQWRDVWLGSFITAVLFTLGKELIGLYLGRSSVASGYGAAGSVVVLLLWVYYASQIVLFGAELVHVVATDGQPQPTPGR